MEVEINWLAVVLAMAASMVVGMVWYAKGVFGGRWAKLVGLSDAQMQKDAGRAIGVTVLVSLVTAYVLAHLTYITNSFYGNSFMQDALTTAVWVWLGFTAARVITHDAFEQRPRALTVMTITHELVTFLAMAVVIGWLKP